MSQKVERFPWSAVILTIFSRVVTVEIEQSLSLLLKLDVDMVAR